MKIAFLSHVDFNLYLFRLPIMQKLVKEGHKVYAVIPKGEFFDKFSEHGIETVEYKIERKSLNPFREFITIKHIYDVIKPLNIDILHSFTVKPNIYGAIAGNLAKVPETISTITGMGSFYIDTSLKAKIVKFIIENLYKFVFKRVTGVIFQNSDDLNHFVEANILDKSKAFLVRSSGVDTEFFSPTKPNAKLKEELNLKDEVVVLMVARAIWHKGIKEYYQSAKVIKDKYKNVKFYLVGGVDIGNHSAVPKEFLENDSNVIWLNERNDIKELISICDIFVLPSYREGVPRTLLEATSMAKAIVTTDTIGCREVVAHNINGFLVKLYDSKDLANKIEILINDKKLRDKFGRNGRIKAINEFDVKVVVDKYLAIYKKFLKDKE